MTFQPFHYCLNLNTPECTQFQVNISKSQSKILSILITPQTNIEKAVTKLCEQNSLNSNIEPILIDSIKEQISNQSLKNQPKKLKDQKKSHSKKFKENFCKFITQTDHEEPQLYQSNNNQSNFTFEDEQSYIFRSPLKQIPSPQNYKQKQSYDIPKVSKISKSKYFESSIGKYENSEKKMSIFESLYARHQQIEKKKDFMRKKSLEKLSFKPQLNKMSKQIVEKRRQISKMSSEKKQQQLINNFTLQSQKAKRPNKFSAKLKSRLQRPDIYERSKVYLSRSQKKLEILRNISQCKQFEQCTFKPQIIKKPSYIECSINTVQTFESQHSF